jgi:hypothetical protein
MSYTDALRTFVVTRKQHAEQHFGPYMRRTGAWYNLYRGYYENRSGAANYRHHIHIPFIFAVIESMVARLAQTSFGNFQPVEFVANSASDTGLANKITQLISSQLLDARSYEKACDLFLSANIYGTGIARVGWRQDVRLEKHRMKIVAPNGQVIEQVKTGEATRFDGPDWNVVDIQDFLPQPGRRRLEEMDYVFHRYFLNLSDLEKGAARGYYNAAAVAQLKSEGFAPQATTDQYDSRRYMFRTESDYQARYGDKFSKPVMLYDYIGLVPRELTTDGVEWRIVTLANDRVIVRDVPMPFWHGKLPFVVFTPMPDLHHFHGIGKAEIAAKMQFMANKFASQKADATDLAIDHMWLVNRLAGIDTGNLIVKAGKIVGVDGPVDDTVIRPIFPDLRGFQIAYQEIAQLWQWIQLGTGAIEDTVMGAPSGADRQTRAEFLGRQENVLTRLMREARLSEVMFIEPLAELFYHNDRQFLSLPHQLRILGSEAIINPDSGLPYPQEDQVVDVEDLKPYYRIHALGATQMLGKSVRQQNVLTMYQMMSAHPVALQAINWITFFRYMFRTFDIANVDDFLVNNVPLINKLAVDGGMPPEGMPPEGDPASEGAGMMGNLDPATMEAAMGAM